MLLMLRGQQILEIEKFDYTRNPESHKFRPVPIKGLKEVLQYPAENAAVQVDVSQPPRRAGGHVGGQSPAHEAHVISAEMTCAVKEVVQSVTDNNVLEPDADYTGPTIKKIENPII